MATKTIGDYTSAVSIDASNDYLLIQSSSTYYKINRTVFLGINGSPVGTSDSQTLTNKTIGITNTVTLTDNLFTLQDNGDNTRQVQFQLSGITAGNTRTLTVPDASLTIVGTATTQTLTNKTLTSPTISGGTIDNTTITVDSIAEHTSANGVTVDGLNIKDGALNTNNSVVTANITDAAVTPAKLVAGTGASWAWQSWTPTVTNLTTTSGTTIAKYNQTGKTIDFQYSFTAGASSSSSGLIRISLPVAMSSNYIIVGAGDAGNGYMGNIVYLNAGVAGNYGQCRIYDSDEVVLQVFGAGSTYVNAVDTDMDASAVPFQLGTGDKLFVWGTYEAA